MEYYSTIKRNIVLTYATARIKLENIMLGKIIHSKEPPYCVISFTFDSLYFQSPHLQIHLFAKISFVTPKSIHGALSYSFTDMHRVAKNLPCLT